MVQERSTILRTLPHRFDHIIVLIKGVKNHNKLKGKKHIILFEH